MSKRVHEIAVAVAILMVVATACSGGDGEGDGGQDGSGDSAAPATFDVSLSEFALTPDMIDAPAGQGLSFRVSNDGTAPHTFAVDTGAGVETTRELQAGETQTLQVPPLAAGTTACTARSPVTPTWAWSAR
jgi:hypothetical protein